MKKVLYGTTALVLTAGAAFAEISMSGSAEIGVADLDDGAGAQFFQDIDITFDLSGETDSGLSFGASVDLDEGGISSTELDDHGTSVFVSGAFGTLTMGDTDGAMDWAMTEVAGLTSIADDHTSHAGYSGNSTLDGSNDGQVLRYNNTIGDIGFALSYEQDVDDTGVGDIMSVGTKFSFGDIGVGVGYQSSDDGTDVVGISVAASMADIDLVVNYSDWSLAGGGSDSHTAIGATYNSGAMGFHVNYGEYDSGDSGFGLAVNYDLGGGAVAALGYGDSDGGASTWSAGLSLSF